MSKIEIKKSAHRIFWLLVAALLVFAGIWYNSPQDPEVSQEQQPGQDTLDKIASIRNAQQVPEVGGTAKSELDLIRERADWSDAPPPAPILVETANFDVYTEVTKEYLQYVFDKLGYTGEKIDSGETEAIPPLFVVSISEGWLTVRL